jgi:hypothetical protein
VLSSGLIRHRRRRRLWRHGGSWSLGGGEMLRKTMRGWAGWVGTCWVAPRGLLVSAKPGQRAVLFAARPTKHASTAHKKPGKARE